ncbi:MAG: D-alanyl-D-alanine carboxypeptidase family protein [Oscillospiraceae bacterium]|nr:D-alanyl-D-alanine carboxypeptidase family protein [Oscillospiraceae bacterium]
MARRRRIRWDRLVGLALVLLILIIMLVSCMKSCFGKSDTPAGASSAPLTSQTGTNTSPAGRSDVSEVTNPSVETTQTTAATTTRPADPGIPSDYMEVPTPYSEIYKGDLVLVNEKNPSHFSKEELGVVKVYEAADNPGCYGISYPGTTFLCASALTPFNKMMKAYNTATNNSEVMFNYGWLKSGDKNSTPESGCGMDIQLHLKKTDGSYGYFTDTAPYSWIFEHMTDYGFVERYPKDKASVTGRKSGYTALRYVGIPHAKYMKDNNLCLEEYLDKLRNECTFPQKLEVTTTAAKYEIYYIAASTEDDTPIPVPLSGEYRISGNNIDGFIVTAAR